jgi:hypothetical protein
MDVTRLTRDQLLERRRNLEYSEYKDELRKRIADKTEVNALYRSNEKYDVRSSCSVVIPEEPFVELLVRKNFPDLLEQALNTLPIGHHSHLYDLAFRESLRKNNVKIFQSLIDKVNINSIYACQPDEATPLMLLVYAMTFFLKDINPSFQGTAHDVIQLMKLLLMHGANPNVTVAGKNPLGVVVQQIKSVNLREQDKVHLMKAVVEVLMIGGADHEKSIDSFPDAVHVAKPLDYACDELRSIMIKCAQRRNALFNDAAKDGDGINLINVSLDQPIKDIYGNSLLFHALKNKNIKVAARLLCLRPELLSQHNFTGEFVWNDANALESLLAIFGRKQIKEIDE